MHLLVIRFSAMGDVAMVRPVVISLLEKFPELRITVLSRPFFEPFFKGEERLDFFGADVKKKYAGAPGLWRLAGEIKKKNFDAVVDLHGVFRSRVFCMMLRTLGMKIIRFKKGRKQKLRAIRTGKLQGLPHTTERYLAAFEKLGLKTKLNQGPWLTPKATSKLNHFFNNLPANTAKIGLAPFAMHPSKEWGLARLTEAMKLVLEQKNVVFLLFGGGERELNLLKIFEKDMDSCINVAGKFSLAEELAIMSKLDVFVSMDSANMHMAALVGTPVVSIWGPTHAALGFGPLGNEQNIVEASRDALPCRPCSIYGKLKTQADRNCAEASMSAVSPKMVADKILSLISQ